MWRLIQRCLVAILAFPALADGLDVSFVLSPAETLPGVPVMAVVTVRNTSAAPVAFDGRVLQFNVTSVKGTPFESSISIPPQYWYGEWTRPAKYVLEPGGKKVLFFKPGTFFESPLFNELLLDDEALISEPGTYEISVTVRGSRGQSATSNVAHLEISTPSGDDQTIWSALRSPHSGGPRFPIGLPDGCPFIRHYPQSRYYHIMSAVCVFHEFRRIGESPEKYVSAVMQAASVLPPETRDVLSFEVGQQYAEAARGAYHNNKHAEAGRISVLGWAFSKQMTEQASTDFGKIAAAWLDTQFHTEREWHQLWAESNGPMQPDRAIVPFVNCVTVNPDGTITAEFGYSNPNNHTVKRSVGERNRIKAESSEPDGAVDFRPGRVEAGFTVKNAKGSVTWTLDGQTVTASPATAPRCEDLAVP